MVSEAEQQCRKHLEAAVGCFRLGMEGQGSEHLVGFIDALQEIYPQFPEDEMQRINPLLNQIIAAQTRKDYLLVADLLEYGKIAPLDPSTWVVDLLDDNETGIT